MQQQIPSQLDKVLALADSTHDAEAIVAVRKARQMLSRDGLSFGDLARAARPGPSRGFSIFSGSSVHLQAEIALLRQKMQDLQEEMQAQALEIGVWRHRADTLERELQQAQTQVDRWQQLARDTVEKLWDLGREMHSGELSTPDAPVQKRA